MEDTLEVTTIVNETPSELDEVKHVVEEVAAAAAKVAEEAAAAKTTQLAEELEKIKITPNSIFKRLKSFFGVNS